MCINKGNLRHSFNDLNNVIVRNLFHFFPADPVFQVKIK